MFHQTGLESAKSEPFDFLSAVQAMAFKCPTAVAVWVWFYYFFFVLKSESGCRSWVMKWKLRFEFGGRYDLHKLLNVWRIANMQTVMFCIKFFNLDGVYTVEMLTVQILVYLLYAYGY